MAYTPPESPLSFDFTDSGYSVPSSPLDFDFSPVEEPEAAVPHSYAEWFDDETQQWYANDSQQWEPIQSEEEGEYTVPSWSDIGFEFSTGGYSAPSWSEIPFRFGAAAFLNSFNLSAYLKVFQRSTLDLTSLIRATILEIADLAAVIEGHSAIVEVNLPAYLKQVFTVYDDLPAFIEPMHIRDLVAYLGSATRGYVDLTAYLKAWYQTDLGVHIRAWQRQVPIDLSAYIFGPIDLSAFLKVDVRDVSNLLARIGVYVPRTLNAYIKGWVYKSPVDLSAYLMAGGFGVAKDLGAYILAKEVGNLIGVIYGIPPKDLNAIIHGWQEVYLSATITALRDRETNLAAYIIGIGGLSLPAYIKGWAFKDLGASLKAWYAADLGAYIAASGGYLGLPALLIARGQAFDLGATITPRLVKLAILLQIHTMEYLDLGAVINLKPCYNLQIVDLMAYMKIFQKHDLLGTIYGFRNLNNQLKDLAASIEITEYAFQTRAVDDFSIFIDVFGFSRALDEFSITFRFLPEYGIATPADLLATITALARVYKTSDLSATINAIAQSSYVFGDPIFGPFESDVTFTAPYIYKNRALWERFVEISFFSQVYEYFYQSVSNSLWRNDETEKWVLNVASWLEEDTYLQDRKSLRAKLVNNIEEFESVDEAIRYAIDWVLTFPTHDLGAQIQGIIPPFADLLARIRAYKTYSSAQNLTANIVPFHLRNLAAYMRIIDEWGDLTATITGTP